MNNSEIKLIVHDMYWQADKNCATVMITILSERFDTAIFPQTVDALIGMHGAGGLGAQCGLVEGTLAFIGVYGKAAGVAEDMIIKRCKRFGKAFIAEFGALDCSTLRPEGFKPDNPPHLCEPLTVNAVHFAIDFIEKQFGEGRQ